MKLKSVLKLIESDYMMSHRPASKYDDVMAPLHDLTGNGNVYPDDIYSNKAIQLYGTHINDLETFNIIKSFKDKPNSTVTIYRAVPPNVTDINPGDWVAITKKYAEVHKKHSGKPDWKIISKKVMVKDVITSGDSWDEWGYDPS